jgi:hypothetical protein
MLKDIGSHMDVKREIVARVDKLPPELQAEVLRFVASLPTRAARGETGAGLRQFSGFLDRVSTQEMNRAIEEHCERVDAGEW